MSTPPAAFVSWSSGKDSAYALYEARSCGLARIAGVLTTLNEAYARVAMHGVREELLDRQIAALGVPALKVMLPDPCSNEVYEARMAQACERIRGQGVTHIVFGDLFLEDVRAYRENGEFHTVVSAGPMFAAPVAVAVGAVIERGGFVFADVAACPASA